MTIKDQISADIKEAMRARAQEKLDTLRMVISAIKNKEIAKKGDLGDEEVISLLSTLVKQRREAADLYRKGDREELALKEEKEIGMLKGYLPEALGEDEIKDIIEEAVNDTAAKSMADMGKVMKAVMAKIAGRAEGGVINKAVKEKLSSL